ncbi:MAG: hypothetical protein RSF86_13415 [Angelakisella sp.]
MEQQRTPSPLAEAERRLYYLTASVRCMEAKLERVEPFGAEFEQTMTQIFEAQDEINALAPTTAQLRVAERRPEYLRGYEHE